MVFRAFGLEDRSPEPHPMLQCPEASNRGGGVLQVPGFFSNFSEKGSYYRVVRNQ